MSKLKKMLSMVLAMVMVLAMSIPTFAANGKTEGNAATGTASDKGTITVSGVEETGVTVKAYQIIKAKYENGGKFSGYESLYPTIITDVTADDISRTVIEVTERIDINKFVAFTHRNSHGYDGLMMLRLLLLAFADNGYASTRNLAELCRTDIRYMFIAQNQKPSHQAFQRFIHDALIMSVEEIFYEMNRIMDDELPIDTDVLCIDGTKYEANANKNTFIWRKNTVRHREI